MVVQMNVEVDLVLRREIGKMKKENVKNIIIGVLCLIVIILIIIMFFIKGSTKYKYYDDKLIEINNKTEFEVKANILYNTTLAVLVKSNEDKTYNGSVDIKAYDELGKQIISDNVKQLVLENNSNVFMFRLPDLDKDQYAGKIKISINKEDVSYKNKMDVGKIKYSLTKKANDDNSLTVDVNFNNKKKKKLSLLDGYIVAFKDNDIVGVQYFNNENIVDDSNVSAKATFVAGTGYKPFEYDKIEVYITHIAGNLQ